MSTFDVGQYVWAKLTGFPHWPAKILELPKSPSSDHYVEFLGPKKTVGDAKVKAVTDDDFDKIVKAGRKAKGQAFMKSVRELQSVMPGISQATPTKSASSSKAPTPEPPRVNGTATTETIATMSKSKAARKTASGGTASAVEVPAGSLSGPTLPVAASYAKKTGRLGTPTATAVAKSKSSKPQPSPVRLNEQGVHKPAPKKRPMDLSDSSPPPLKMKKTAVPADSTSKVLKSVNPTLCRGNYGFIGLGIMGTEMAANLLKSNHNVVVWNRSGVQHTDLASCGAQVAVSPAEVVDRSDIVFTCVSTPEAAMDVVMRENGVLQAMCRGKGYVDMSTVDSDTSQAIGQKIHATGGMFLEAPVSGSKKPAQDGQLIILTAGDCRLFDLASPAFDAMGKAHYYLGEVGNAARMKLIVNMVMGSMASALSEGMALAKEAGLSQKMLHQVLRDGALNSKMVEAKGGAIIKGEYPASFPLKHQQKDMRLALALGDQVHQPLPIAAAANETYKRALQLGCADEDMSAVYQAHASQSSSKR